MIYSKLIRITGFSLLLCALLGLGSCGGGGGGSGGSTSNVSYPLSGQALKGPFTIGSQITINAQDSGLNPTGTVYNVQTSDSLGDFTVAPGVNTNLVEIVGDGFYMDELTGQLSPASIQLRAIADLSVSATPTVNILTSLQEPRLKALLAQGSAFAAAYTQSQTEVLAIFGIDATQVNALSTLYSLQFNGSTDADGVLLATSVILDQMATDASIANGTTAPAELSNEINTLAAQLASTGTVTSSSFINARNLAESEINLATVRSNVASYYAAHGVSIVVPPFQQWINQSGVGTLPQAMIVLVANTSSQNISCYTASAAGALTSIAGSPFASGSLPGSSESLTIDPTGKFAYMVNHESNVAGYTIDPSSGVLAPISGSPFAAVDPISIVVHPSGKFAYVANQLDGSFSFSGIPFGSIGAYAIDATSGALASIAGSPFETGVNPQSLAVDPTGKFLYAANSQDATISAYSVNATTGALTPLAGSPFAAGTVGQSLLLDIVVDPTGHFVYVADSVLGNVNGFTIDTSSGALSAIAGSPYAAGTSPNSVAVDPSGKFVYAANTGSNNVSAYTINATTGALAPIPGSPFAAGSDATAVRVDPTGQFVYVANQTSNNIYAYDINPTTGVLTTVVRSPFANSGVTPFAIAIRAIP